MPSRCLFLTAGAAVLAAAASSKPWMDAAAPIDDRVEALLAVMTNEEKQSQTIHLTGGNLTDVVARYGATGLGAFPLYTGSAAAIADRNALQAAIMNTSRLHIPVTFHTESLHGGCGGCVVFPMPAGQGSTWDTALAREIASVVALEAWAVGVDRGFSPEINVPTDPRFGRTEENFGEDPALVAAFGVAAVLGLHNGSTGGPSTYLPAVGAIASEAKHAAAYAFGGKDGMAADVSERTLHDVYLRPWLEYAEAGGRGAMLAHNSINAAPCHASGELMGWLRAQGTMNGSLLGSDMCDVGLLGPAGFRVSADLTGSAVLAMSAGLDQELCNPYDGRGTAFPLVAAAVADGRLAQVALDRAAANALRPKFAAGLFDGRAIIDASNLPLLNSPAHREVARRAAREGAVLLKNDGTLPLRLDPARPTAIAVVGPLAGCAGNASDCDATRSQCGGYTNYGVEVASVLAAGYNESGARITYAPGCAVGGNDTSGFAAAVAAARSADVVVMVAGDSGGLGWNRNTCGEDDDRADLELPGAQADLASALAATGTPLVLVLLHGRPVTFARLGLLPRVAALLAAWRPGCEGGGAIWDLLSGRASPSGRLAQAWVRGVGQVKSQASPWFSSLQGDFDQVAYNGDIMAKGVDDGSSSWAPQFPFGFGLSYTTFSMQLLAATANASHVTATVNVTNTGGAAARQVVGVYYSRPLSAFVRAHKRLLTFAKTAALAPGEAVVLVVAAPLRALASYDPQLRAQVVEPGAYTVSIGPDSATEAGAATVVV